MTFYLVKALEVLVSNFNTILNNQQFGRGCGDKEEPPVTVKCLDKVM